MVAKSGGKAILAVDCADTLQVKILVKITLSCCFSEINVFYAKIQDGCQKWQENNFCVNSPVESAHTLWFKNFVKITLASSVSEINPFLCFNQNSRWQTKEAEKHRNSRWPPKAVGKQFLQKFIIRVCIFPVDQKFGRNQSSSLCFQDKNVFVFNTEIQDGCQMWRHNDFWKKFFGSQ